ncbi:MAG: alcohol dehydrogenase catalytic domain-containing protein [Candidatus Lokiarchaeota archaeon]|nr:alcohol dehydrogenase catalytic domain-containing protein [Candidatus Lokiarchaeota archaeon]MBD3201624.1 alcohol dehydrogenase catalytic domain-containing protein [Candidatus Lokiarchaeota archaeon]
MDNMKAAIYNGNSLKIENIKKPMLKDSQVLVKVKSVGICGTDIAINNGHLKTPTPIILGHEFSGEITEVGSNIDPTIIGKRVTSEINSNIDFSCYFCKRGLFSQCESRKALGIDINGALAEYIALDDYLIHDIPDNLTYEEATFIEPLAAAYQVFEMMPKESNDKILTIFGLGRLGLLITQVAKQLGFQLICVDKSEKKLALAQKFGANFMINSENENEVVQEIRDLTDGLGSDIVLDTTGNPDALNEIIKSCRTRGKIHIKSTHGLNVPINLTDIVVRELKIFTSRCGPFEKSIQGLYTGKIQVNDLISRQYELNEIYAAFKSYENKDIIKTLINIS